MVKIKTGRNPTSLKRMDQHGNRPTTLNSENLCITATWLAQKCTAYNQSQAQPTISGFYVCLQLKRPGNLGRTGTSTLPSLASKQPLTLWANTLPMTDPNGEPWLSRLALRTLMCKRTHNNAVRGFQQE